MDLRNAVSVAKSIPGKRTMSFKAIVAENISDSWFAGFCDGECNLGIAGHGGSLQPRFRLNQRDDDGDLVRAIRDFIGVGNLCQKVYRNQANAKPQLALNVVGADCLRVVNIFDRSPLRSKKRHEYPIWRKAVEIYSSRLGNRWTPEVVKERSELLAPLKSQLTAIRKYGGPS